MTEITAKSKGHETQSRVWKVAGLIVVTLVALGLAYLIGTHLDVYWFATTNPTTVRKAILLHAKAAEVGASASAQLEDGAYSYSVK